jgi:hypothetical protein
MSYLVTTPLGRSVPDSDWKSLQADTIVRLLFDISRSPFNPNNDPVEIAVLSQATGVRPPEIYALLAALVAQAWLEVSNDPQGKPSAARLTDHGRERVSFQLSRPVEASGSAG